MCAFQTAQYQQDHGEISRLVKPITLHEVSIFYRFNNQAFELILDPADVRVALWDPAAVGRFPDAPGQPGNLHWDDRNGRFPVRRAEETFAFGVEGHIHFQMRDGSWEGIHEKVVVTHVVPRYTSRADGKSYEVVLLATSSNPAYRATRERPLSNDAKFDAKLKTSGNGGFTGAQINNGVDVFFWDEEACEAYRREFVKTHVLNRHRLFKANGDAQTTQLDDEKLPHEQPLFKPKLLTRELIFHSVTCKLCYHYESCEWVCTADAP